MTLWVPERMAGPIRKLWPVDSNVEYSGRWVVARLSSHAAMGTGEDCSCGRLINSNRPDLSPALATRVVVGVKG